MMCDMRLSAAFDALLPELLAAIKANIPVASYWRHDSDAPSLTRDWEVWDGDCAARIREAAASLKRIATRDMENFAASIDEKQSFPRVALWQELLAAIEDAKPIESGTGRCWAVPCFDHHDREAEDKRPSWEIVERKHADRVRNAAATLHQN